ncbi:MAG: DUF4251 domain-containing protein [Rikenellaceae bacterium]
MKKITILMLCLMALGQQVMAQESKGQVRKQKRAQELKMETATTQGILASRNFVYTADELVSTGTVDMQNINLTSTYGVWVLPGRVTVLLPVYGVASSTGLPTLTRTLDFTTTNYTYSITTNPENKGWYVHIKVVNPWTMTTYYMMFNVTDTGMASGLTLSSPFTSEVVFSGAILPYN